MPFEIEYTTQYAKWFKKLKEQVSKARIITRMNRVQTGNFGDVKNIDGQISEMRFTFGAGIRVYYTIENNKVLFLLIGGDKSSQQNDIQKARIILESLER